MTPIATARSHPPSPTRGSAARQCPGKVRETRREERSVWTAGTRILHSRTFSHSRPSRVSLTRVGIGSTEKQQRCSARTSAVKVCRSVKSWALRACVTFPSSWKALRTEQRATQRPIKKNTKHPEEMDVKSRETFIYKYPYANDPQIL